MCYKNRTSSLATNTCQLFGDLWREGELAVLFANTGVGKSILAVQIAESIARGRSALMENGELKMENGRKNSQFSTFNSQLRRPQPVVYIDLERSETQFYDRYTVPSPIPGKLPVRYRFSRNMTPIGISDFDEVPAAFKGDINKYLFKSIRAEIQRQDAKVVIIDSISYLAATARATEKLIKSLHLWTRLDNLSILAVAHSRDRRRPRLHLGLGHLELSDLTSPQIAQTADTVFAIGRSTFGPDIRYVKHLKSNSAPVEHDASNVLVCQIERTACPAGTVNRKRKQVSSERSPENGDRLQVNASDLSFVSSQQSLSSASPSPVTTDPSLPPTPFLGFSHLGMSAEQDHLRDYEAEYRDAERRELERLKRARTISAREALVQGIINGSYERYLKG